MQPDLTQGCLKLTAETEEIQLENSYFEGTVHSCMSRMGGGVELRSRSYIVLTPNSARAEICCGGTTAGPCPEIPLRLGA